MEVERPAARRDNVVEFGLLENVLLAEDVIPDEASRFAFPGCQTDPFQCQIFDSFLRKRAGVFDVVPNAVDYLPKLELDALMVIDRVEYTAIFDPPVMAALGGVRNAPELRNRRGTDVDCERWFDESHRLIEPLREKVDGIPECLPVGMLRRHHLTELVARLSTDSILRTSEKSEDAVARRVEVHGAAQDVFRLRRTAQRGNRRNRTVIVDIKLIRGGIE